MLKSKYLQLGLLTLACPIALIVFVLQDSGFVELFLLAWTTSTIAVFRGRNAEPGIWMLAALFLVLCIPVCALLLFLDVGPRLIEKSEWGTSLCLAIARWLIVLVQCIYLTRVIQNNVCRTPVTE